jgi:hypothetical protein
MFALRVNLSYQHIKMGVASLSRETRPFVLRVILTINKSQRGGDHFSFSFKGSKGVSCLSEEATSIADYVLSLLSTCDTPISPERFYNFSKEKEGPLRQ